MGLHRGDSGRAELGFNQRTPKRRTEAKGCCGCGRKGALAVAGSVVILGLVIR